MNDFKCISQYRLDHPNNQRCYSPTACAAFGYCRERNHDGYPMDEINIKRRKEESDKEPLTT